MSDDKTDVSDEVERTGLETVIERVCVFREGAEVTRTATVPAGVRTVAVRGLPLCLDDGTVRVRAEGGVHATGVRVTLEASGGEPSADLASAEDEALTAAKLAVDRWRTERSLLEESIESWTKLAIPARAVPRDGAPGPSPHAARLALADARQTRLEALHRQLVDLVEQGRPLNERLRVLQDRRRRDTQARERAEHELRKAVVIDLDAAPSGPVVLRVSYAVPGARWAPSYVLRIDEEAGEARLELRAMVAQHTGENWTAVPLDLSTATPARFVDVPELRSQRIGRAQRRPPDRGWRPPPADTSTLLDDYLRARRTLDRDEPDLQDETVAPDDGLVSLGALVAGGAAPMPQAVPMAAAHVAAPEGLPLGGPPPGMGPPPHVAAEDAYMLESMPAQARSSRIFGGSSGMRRMRSEAAARISLDEPVALRPADDWLDYGRLRMPPPRQTSGQLAATRGVDLYLETVELEIEVVRVALRLANTRAVGIESLASRFVAPEPEDAYDYAYSSDAPVDVPADGGFHNVPIQAAAAPLNVSLIVVPRASTDAYRQGELENPLLGPLLPGPVDVYLGRDFLTSTRARFTPPGGRLRLGLGVAQGLKVARNARFYESSAGLMGGSLVLHHDIEIELASHLDQPQRVEVRERVPVLRDKEEDIKLTVRDVQPPWEAYEPPDDGLRGAHRWQLTIAPKETTRLRFGYDIRIASKNELRGGNRRED